MKTSTVTSVAHTPTLYCEVLEIYNEGHDCELHGKPMNLQHQRAKEAIVRAVNLHEELLETLKSVRDWEGKNHQEKGFLPQTWGMVMNHVKEVIIKAEAAETAETV